MTPTARDERVGVVIATRNRRGSLLVTLDHLMNLPEEPAVVVVDNGSTDGTAGAIRDRHPDVMVLELDANHGAAARTAGAALLPTPYVAFADDDSWWAAGALRRAGDELDAHPRLGLIAARILVGPEQRLDPICTEMADSPIDRTDALPFPRLLGFLACGAVVRKGAFLAAGGFHPRYGLGGEERLLALDLAAAGWQLAYVHDIIAHHHPSPLRDPARRHRLTVRNDLWTLWLRRRVPSALRQTGQTIRRGWRDAGTRHSIIEALAGMPWVLAERRPVPPQVEADARLVERRAPRW